MDGERFDRLARTVGAGASRRRVLGTMAAAAGALLGRSATAAATPFHPGPVRLVCGGPDNLPCPDGADCLYPDPACSDPALGCHGVCAIGPVVDPGPAPQPMPQTPPCAAIRCMAGTHCCDVCGGACVDASIDCAAVDCRPVDPVDGEPCGDTVCGEGTYCCNAGCGICAPIGAMCINQVCS